MNSIQKGNLMDQVLTFEDTDKESENNMEIDKVKKPSPQILNPEGSGELSGTMLERNLDNLIKLPTKNKCGIENYQTQIGIEIPTEEERKQNKEMSQDCIKTSKTPVAKKNNEDCQHFPDSVDLCRKYFTGKGGSTSQNCGALQCNFLHKIPEVLSHMSYCLLFLKA